MQQSNIYLGIYIIEYYFFWKNQGVTACRRWEALAASTPLLLPRICRRWEVLATAAPLLPRSRRRLHRMTRWRCRWSVAPLLLIYASGLLLL
jgi:hypothetical protein